MFEVTMLKLVLLAAIAADAFLVVSTTGCKPNEEYTDCINGGCTAQNCSQLGVPLPCLNVDPKDCIPGYICKSGYTRADNGTCIPTDQCPSCGGDPNAVLGCGTFCTKCSNYNKGPIACPAICKINACDCKKGYIYDQNIKKCVLPKQCTPTCKDNEEYSDCVNGGCSPRNCSQLGKPQPCVKLSPDACIKGCVCKSGYLKADNGTCIPAKQCPSCGGDPNAESGCGTFCKRCSNYKNETLKCPIGCILNGCQCKDGFIYDQNIKKCVRPKECTPTCKANEEYSDCVNGGCARRNCSQLGKPVRCVKLKPSACIKGCVCKSGYLKAKNGTCIPVKQCPCKPNEEYSDCINRGCYARNCSQLGVPLACADVEVKDEDCIEGFICKSGYTRADNGTCIPTDQCPSCGGDPNAESGCGSFCKTCSNYKNDSLVCPIGCILNGCQCREGYIYDQNIKKCVLPEQCTPTCKINEVYSECTNTGCTAQNCSQLGTPVPCVRLDPKYCKKGCVCDAGFLRADNGTCIPEKECPACGDDPNAESGCGTFCETCTNYKSGPVACPEICLLNGCQCKAGYIYDPNIKKCVLPEQCTPTCKANEVFSDCINSGCDPRNCSQLGNSVPCVDLSPNACIKGCICASGFLRADNGTCIPEKQCPSCGGDPNAESGCGVFCDRCSGPIPCPRICYPNSCQCKSGYIYDQNIKKCVLPNQCTPTCKDNEEYSDCINGGCDARNCSQLGNSIPCVKLNPDDCVKGCVCSSGYLRADNGTCIPEKQCPSCGGDPNAESGCGVFCDRCSGPIPCPRICHPNSCQCKSGYIYDQNIKKCVLPNQCTPTCKDNEEYSDCINGGCDARNCSQLGNPVPCVKLNPDDCVKGCICSSGYLRADNGTCISVKECPSCGGDSNAESGCGVFCNRCSGPIPCPKICEVNGCQCKPNYIYDDNTKKCVLPEQCTPTCKDHEVYSDCINGGCLRRNCSQVGKPVPCVLVKKGGCIKGCVCESGYLRDNKGNCIPEDQCQCCQEGEVYSKCANGICPPQNCSLYGKPLPQCAPISPKYCKPGCICANGNLRNKDGVCIPKKKCPEASCKANEVYSDCINGGCDARNCSQLGNPVPCVKIRPEDCKKGCICDQGFLRADNGTCIPKKQCPSCGGDPNAEAGCGVFCDLCSGPIPCPKICKINGCQCKPGYKYDQNIQKCVLPKECTPTCKSHEVYSDCINGGSERRNCSQLDKPVASVSIIEGGCIKGCVCESGYLRADNGTCIPESQCPRCKAGEEYSTCSNGICRLQHCSQYGQPIPFCPAFNTSKCKPGCICRKKFLKNDNGVCIPQEECPEAQCPPGEIYSQCSNAPCKKQYCIQYGQNFPSCPITEPKKCKPGCICKDGYLRTQGGMCVPEDACLEAQPPCLDKK